MVPKEADEYRARVAGEHGKLGARAKSTTPAGCRRDERNGADENVDGC
jgi:hypothetical protein